MSKRKGKEVITEPSAKLESHVNVNDEEETEDEMQLQAGNDHEEMSSSGASNCASSNPMKKNSGDIAWEWGECRDPSNKNYIWCKLCGKRVSGGIYRFKHHLVHKKGNTTGCPNVTPEVQQKVNDWMKTKENKKRKVAKARIKKNNKWFEDVGVAEEREMFNSGGSERQGIEGATMQPHNVLSLRNNNKRSKADSDDRGPLDNILRPNYEMIKEAELNKIDPRKEKLKNDAWYFFAKWAYSAGIPLDAVNSPCFQPMINAIGEYGRGLPVPSYDDIQHTLLYRILEETEKFVDSFRVHWKSYGCSIMLDFRTDGEGRCLINFLVNCLRGTVFLNSIDASEHVKDANLIAEMINEVILDVGKENVVQVITNNGPIFKAAGRILEEQHPKIFWTPCAAQCLNLMLQDCEKLQKIERVLAESRSVVVYIYNHEGVLNMLQKLNGGRELHKSCVTRFATSYYTLRSIWENRYHLPVMFVSEQWAKSDLSEEPAGKHVKEIISECTFWDNVQLACQVLGPLVDELRLLYSEEKPCIGYIFEAMDKVKKQIQKNLGPYVKMCTHVFNIIDKRWNDQIHHPLHAAGFYLNPRMYYKHSLLQMEGNANIKSGLLKAIDRLVFDKTEIDQVMSELTQYRDATGQFGSASAKRLKEKVSAGEWWLLYGFEVPTLQKFAIKVLNQTCSASPCEQNWHAIENLYSKRRNCILQSKLNDVVFIQYNKKFEQRFKERSTINGKFNDPIILTEVDENDDWLIPTDEELKEFVMKGDDLAWEEVQEARGAADAEPKHTLKMRIDEAVEEGGEDGEGTPNDDDDDYDDDDDDNDDDDDEDDDDEDVDIKAIQDVVIEHLLTGVARISSGAAENSHAADIQDQYAKPDSTSGKDEDLK